MSIRSKVITALVFVMFLFGTVSIYNYSRLNDSYRHLVLINEVFIPLSRVVAQLQTKVGSLAEDMKRFYFNRERTSEQTTLSRVVRDLYPYIIHRKFDDAEALLDGSSATKNDGLTKKLLVKLRGARDDFSQLIKTDNVKSFESRYKKLSLKLHALSNKIDQRAQSITQSAQAKGRNHLLASLALSFAVLVFGAFTLVFSLRALRPLPNLIESLKKIGDGDFLKSLKVKVSAKDEVSLLAREYNRMLDALVERDKKIRSQQRELLKNERLAAVGQLSAEVVHEIRNPLNSINLNIDWLQYELKQSSNETKKTLASISREIQRLNQITESYLVRARVPSGNQERAEVHKVLREVIEFGREEDRERKISIITSFSHQDIFVKTSHSRLKQAFINLLKNAREAMPRGGEIHLRTKMEDNLFTIEVTDSGSGMIEDVRRKTFTPFYTTKENGTGLGLVLTQEIVGEAQGQINCKSRLGEGTTFTLQFPA